MRRINHILAFIDRLNEWMGKIIGPICLIMIAVLMWEIVLRYWFNNPTIWAHETSAMLFGAYFMLGAGYTLLHRVHVNMDIVYSRFSLRERAILDLVGSLLFFVFVGIILWQGVIFASESLLSNQHTTSMWKPPLYPIKMTIPLGAFLLLLQGLAKFIRDLTTAVTGRETI